MTSELLARFATIILDTLVPIALGYFLHRAGWITKQGIDWVIKFNVRVVFTVLSILAFWKLRLTWEVMMVPVATVVMTFIPYFLMTALTRRVADPLERGAMITSGMLGNVGTLGGVICYLVIGPLGFSYVQIMAAVLNVILILFNFPLCQRYRDMAQTAGQSTLPKRSFVSLFFTWNQVALLGMLLGMGLSFGEVNQPAALEALFGPMVHISAWIAFLPVGLLLDFRAATRAFRATVPIFPVKFLFLPIVMWVFCHLTMTDETMLKAVVLVSACPTAINAVLACALYGLKTEVAISSLMSTTLVYCALICPIMVWLFI